MRLENYFQIKAEVESKSAKLIAVCKNQSMDDVKKLYNAGCRVFAENRVQELLLKAKQLPDDIEWHLIGSLQKNKVKDLVSVVTMIHSVDSYELATVINNRSVQIGKVTPILLQLLVAQEETKHGYLYSELIEESKKTEWMELSHISINGIMGMASFTEDKDQIRAEFRLLKKYFTNLKDNFSGQNQFNQLSMGMSSDYKIALEEGSTMVRIGSLLFQ